MLADDDMIDEVDLKKIRPVPESRGQTPIGIRWVRATAGVVMGEHECERIRDNNRAKYFPRVRSALAYGSQRNKMIAFRA